MKHFHTQKEPHKLKILIQSPGFSRNLYNLGYFYKHYQQLIEFEKIGVILLIIAVMLYMFKIYNQIGIIGDFLIIIFGATSTGVVIMPAIMLILMYKWKKQYKIMIKILKHNHLEKYSKQCFKLSKRMVNKKKD